MLKISANPTFTSRVTIPTPEGPIEIKVTYKHRDTDELAEFLANEPAMNRSNEDAIMDLATGWANVDGEFNRENIAKVCKQYHQAAAAICEAYFKELTQARVENFGR